MTNLEKYYELMAMSDKEEDAGNEKLSDKYASEAHKIMNNLFSRQEWENLIKNTSNHWGKAALAMKMKEKFPD